MQIFLLLKSHHLGMISHLIFLSLLGTIIFPYGELTTPTRPPIPKSGVLAPNSRIDAYALNTHVICGWLYINVLLLYRWRRVVICSSGHEVRYRCSRVMPIGSCALGNRRQLSIDACNGEVVVSPLSAGGGSSGNGTKEVFIVSKSGLSPPHTRQIEASRSPYFKLTDSCRR